MEPKIVVGLDLSIAATGACWRVSENTEPTVETWRGKPVDGDERLVRIADLATGLCLGADLVVIEDLPTHAKSAGITGMVHGAVRASLLAEGVTRYALVTPATLKKFATGKGNADKTAMAIAALKRGGREFADDNQCDAFWLWVAGMTHLGAPPFDLPAAQVEALEKVEWPDLAVAAVDA